jgi:hypothetical protein
MMTIKKDSPELLRIFLPAMKKGNVTFHRTAVYE